MVSPRFQANQGTGIEIEHNQTISFANNIIRADMI